MTRHSSSFTGDLFTADLPRAQASDAPARPARVRTPDTVTQLTRRIRGLIELNLASVWVEGELSNFKLYEASGHFYFTLKDATSQIRGVMFRGANARLKFKPDNGMKVVVTGSVQIYEQRGEYQIVCETMEPSGIGALMLAFEQLKKRLAEEGLFAEERKKPLPMLPRTVGVVTSEKGAAIRDIINVLFRRFPGMRLVLNPVPVQGEGAADKIAHAIDECNELNRLHLADPGKHRLWFDVLIVGRGGGSMEDLWAFNEEVVARAIAQSDIPVISAVGHETDWTIADFVADVRAATPSQAAELVVQPRDAFARHLDECSRRINDHVARMLESFSRRVEAARTHYALHEPARLVDQHQQHVDDLLLACETVMANQMTDATTRLDRARHVMDSAHKLLAQHLEQSRQTLGYRAAALGKALDVVITGKRYAVVNQVSRLEALGPASVVKRGYTITRNAGTGKVLTSAAEVKEGDTLRTDFRDGQVESVVRAEISEVRNPKSETNQENGKSGGIEENGMV